MSIGSSSLLCVIVVVVLSLLLLLNDCAMHLNVIDFMMMMMWLNR